jgi:hypothetical protein
MIILSTVQVIASAAAAILTTATIHNVVETYLISSSSFSSSPSNVPLNDSKSLVAQYLVTNWNYDEDKKKSDTNSDSTTTTTTTVATVATVATATTATTATTTCSSNNLHFKSTVPIGKTEQDVIHDLQCMNRRDLLTVFKHCHVVPHDQSSIEGEWDGILLNNNLVLVRLSKITINNMIDFLFYLYKHDNMYNISSYFILI